MPVVISSIIFAPPPPPSATVTTIITTQIINHIAHLFLIPKCLALGLLDTLHMWSMRTHNICASLGIRLGIMNTSDLSLNYRIASVYFT
jgi:hypothetical protein